MEGHHYDWVKQLKIACFAYNTIVHATTGCTPFNHLHGHVAQLPIDIVLGSAPLQSITHNDYVAEMHKRLESISDKVCKKSGQEQLQYGIQLEPENNQVGLVLMLHTAIKLTTRTYSLNRGGGGGLCNRYAMF